MKDKTMTIAQLQEIAAKSGIQHAEYCLEQHTTQVGREAAEPLWVEMLRLTEAEDGLSHLPDFPCALGAYDMT